MGANDTTPDPRTQASPTPPAPAAQPLPTPPGPRAPALIQTAMMLRDPVGFLERCAERYGPVFRVRVISASRYIYVADPALAREALASDRGPGRAGEARRPFLEPLVGENSILCLEGERWLAQREALGPAFHGGRVESYREQIAAIAAEEIESWPSDTPFELRPRMQAITLEVILRLVFGIRDAARLARVRTLVPPLLSGRHWFAIWALPHGLRARVERSSLLRRVPGNPIARFARLREQLDEILFAEIARRRRAPRGEEEDVLSILVREQGSQLGDQELRDELVTLLSAGHETTATSLAWTFERLLRAPDVLDRLREEVAEQGSGGEYLQAVVKESLRTRPVVLDAPRLLRQPLRIGGFELPSDWYVAPAIPVVQNDPELLGDPGEFRPERFLEDDPPYQAWMPFGGGRRRCLGSHLALLELATVVAEVLQRTRLQAPEPGPEHQQLRHVTLVPGRGTRVIAAPPAPVAG